MVQPVGESVGALADSETASITVAATIGVRDGGRRRKFAALSFFAANAVSNLMNFGFHSLLSRSLGPSDYSALGACLAVILVAGVPLNALQLSFAKAGTSIEPDSNARGLVARTFCFGLLVLGVGGALSPVLDGLLNLGSVLPAIWLAAWIATSVAGMAPQGLLMGQERFGLVAAAVFLGGGCRLLMGVITAEFGLGVSGAVASSAVGQTVTLVIVTAALAPRLRSGGLRRLRVSATDNVTSVLALTGLALFAGTDSLLARPLLGVPSSGYYIAASTIGRVALFAPGAVALIVFPRFAAQPASGGQENNVLLRQSLITVGAIAVLVASILAAFPSLVVHILFGRSYDAAVHQVALLAASGALLGLLELTTYVHIARGSRLAQLGWAAAALTIVIAGAVRPDAHRLAIIVLVVAASAATASAAAAFTGSTLSSSLPRQPEA